MESKSKTNTDPKPKPFQGIYISDVRWFGRKYTAAHFATPIKALREQIRYISRDGKYSKLSMPVYMENLDQDMWYQTARAELLRRKDAKLAGRFILALPNDMVPETAAGMIKRYWADTVGTDVGMAIHDDESITGKRNKHAHVIFALRKADGKKIDLNRNDLKRIHANWRKILKEYGYEIILNRPKDRQKHIGPILYSDEELCKEHNLRLANIHLDRIKAAIEARCMELEEEKEIRRQEEAMGTRARDRQDQEADLTEEKKREKNKAPLNKNQGKTRRPGPCGPRW